MPIFDNGPPQHGPPIFDGGQGHPGNFHGNNLNPSGMPRPQFGEFGPNRGSQRGGWRGRGNNPFNGRGGRGGFRDGPPGKFEYFGDFDKGDSNFYFIQNVFNQIFIEL